VHRPRLRVGEEHLASHPVEGRVTGLELFHPGRCHDGDEARARDRFADAGVHVVARAERLHVSEHAADAVAGAQPLRQPQRLEDATVLAVAQEHAHVTPWGPRRRPPPAAQTAPQRFVRLRGGHVFAGASR
jgi:hypothetical protein